MPAPTFLVLGAQKAGTTWLARMVEQHPEVASGFSKELHFFDNEEKYARGLGSYEDMFVPKPGHKAVGEYTPNYLLTVTPDPFFGSKAERITEAYPSLRYVVSLRDPVARTISAYYHHMGLMRVSPGTSIREFAEERPSILWHGHYDVNLTRWFEHAPRDRFLILVYEDHVKPDEAKAETVARVFVHIGVDPAFEPEGLTARHNTRGTHFNLRVKHVPRLVAALMRRLPEAVRASPRWDIPVSDADRAWLTEHFSPHVRATEALLGRELPWPR